MLFEKSTKNCNSMFLDLKKNIYKGKCFDSNECNAMTALIYIFELLTLINESPDKFLEFG